MIYFDNFYRKSTRNHLTVEPTGNRFCFVMDLLRVLYSWPEIGLGSIGNRTSGLLCTNPPTIGSSLSLSLSLISLFLLISHSLSRHLSLSRAISLSFSDLLISLLLSVSLFASLSHRPCPSLSVSDIRRKKEKTKRKQEE